MVNTEVNSDNESKLTIQLNNFTDDSRVHLYATQFQPNDYESLRKVMQEACSDQISVTNFPFAKWKNMFESNNTIGDEIRYVFDRQKKENRMGNTLDRPTLLMNRLFTKSTSTKDEVIKKGTEYAKHDLGRKEVAEQAQYRGGRAMKRRDSHPFIAGDELKPKNGIKDLQNFLSFAPL